MPDPSSAVLRPGTLFRERYRVARCIKAGGMGAVYEVFDELTDSRRALKVMLPALTADAGLRARFAQEARITGGVESDHLVNVFDAGVDAATGTPFLVMELLRGEELGGMLAARGPLSPDDVVTYLSQAARALDKTHTAGIVHRDLKPENLFVARRDDGSPCLKILDFGIAKLIKQGAHERPTQALGTPLYMAPEQVSGRIELSPRADLYALGQIAYTLLVGKAYWLDELRGSGGVDRFFAKVRAGVKEPPSARAAHRGVELGAAFDGWFLKATALAPEGRFVTASEQIAALAEALVTFKASPPAALRGTSPPPDRWASTTSAEERAEGDERERVGPFRLIEDLGYEGAAPVWLAEETFDGRRLRDVALMLFRLPAGVAPSSPEAGRLLEAIVEEARALCRVEHPSVARFHALHHDRARGVVALAMEHVPGPSLDVLLYEGRLDERAILDAGVAVAWALAAVHNAGLVHRDVKPGNVIQGPTGYKLVNFGIAADAAPLRSLSEPGDLPAGVTADGTAGTQVLPATLEVNTAPPPSERAPAASAPPVFFAGTPGYVAPECVIGGAPPSPSTDLYALGVTLFKLATGELPYAFGAGDLAGGAAPPRLDARLPEATAATVALAGLVEMLLYPDPLARPRHADWVARELERARSLLSPRGEAPAGEAETPAAQGAASRGDLMERDAARRQQRPPPLARCPPLVGRAAALAALGRAAREAKQGGVRFSLITGPPGIGRSRLLEAAIEEARAEGFQVLLLRGSPERKGALRPLLRALEEHERSSSHGALRPLKEAAQAALAAAPRGPREPLRAAIEGVEEALLWASADAPLALAFDDLQWADAQSLELCRLLVERASEGEGGSFHLLVVAAARNEPSPPAPLRALLTAAQGRARAGVKHVALGPLTAAEAADIAQGVSPLAPELERAVVHGAGGVPFFVVHALSVFRETGAISFRDGAFRAVDERALSGDVPGVAELVEATIASYFDPGSAAERAALRALAAIALYGGGLGIEIVLRVVGGDPADVEAAIEVLSAAGIVTVRGERQECGFAQEMVRQAAQNLVRQRPWFFRLHRALLDAIAEGASGAQEAAFLANGYEKLGAREPARVWLARGMATASAAGLFVEAAELGDRLAALTPEPDLRAAAELDVVRALLQARQFGEAKRRLDRLDARAKAAPSAEGLRRRIYRLEAAYGLREAAADPTIVADADALSDLPLRCEARMALACVSPEGPAMALLGEAVALSERAGPEVEHAARALRIERNHASSRFDRALAEVDLTRALALATATGSTWQSIIIEGDLAIIEADLGRLDGAIERMRRLIDRTVELGMRWQTPLFSQNLSALLLRAGRHGEAAAAASRTAELAAAAGDPIFRATALSLRADALRRAGELAEALASVDEAEQLQRERSGRSRALTLLRRAMIQHALGRADEALADARAAREAAERHADPDVALGARAFEALRRAQRGEAARAQVEQAVAAAGEVQVRMLTREILAEASAWLAGEGRCSPP